MKIVRATLLGSLVCLLAACGGSELTAPESPQAGTLETCGYLGSAGCPKVPVDPTP